MQEDDFERRSSLRCSGIPGTAVVLGQLGTGSFAIENLSATGASLVGDLALAPAERVKLLLHIEGERSLGVTAEVVRADPLVADRHRVAVRFHEVPDEIRDRIVALVSTALDRQWIASAPALLVVDDHAETALAVERDLVGLGWTVVPVATSTELMQRLGDPSLRFEAALVEICLGRVNASGLLSHLAEQHPRVRRVLMSARALSDDCEAELSTGRAQMFLPKPWQRETLMDVLGASDRTDRVITTDPRKPT